MIKLSVVIITYNEELNIERCLKSVKEIADEIIVLDSFSEDKTQMICSQYNVKFIQHKFDNFAEQKNRAVSFASNNFILSLDADEALSEKLQKSIKSIDDNDYYGAYRFNRLNIYCGKPIKHTSWYPDKKIRLWNKNAGKWAGNIHETVKIIPNSKIKFLTGDLLHYSFNSITEHVKQTNKFTDIQSEKLFLAGKKSSLLIIFYKTFFAAIKEYFVKTAFFGGFYGIVIAYNNVFSVFLKYSKLLAKIKSEKGKTISENYE